jgi:putative colanic acid biosynthesis UDP-glucose lipid carrier transferase
MNTTVLTGAHRSVLRRRSGISGTVQAGLDGLAIIGIAWGLIRYHIGMITPEYMIMLLLLLGSIAITFDQMAIYRTNRSYTQKALVLFQAWALSFLVLTLIGFLSQQGSTFSRALMAQLFVAGYSAHAVLHLGFYLIRRSWHRHNADVENALVIGHGDLAAYLATKVSANPWLSQRLVGKVVLDEKDIEDKTEHRVPLLGTVKNIERIIEENEIRVVYLVTPLESSKVLEDVYFNLLDQHVTIHWVPDIFSLRLVNHSVNEIAGIPVMTLSETPLTGTRLFLKSLEDKVLSALLILLFSPVLLAVAIAVRLDSPGPVIFRQQRAGWNGKNFSIWKFRSMYVHQPDPETLKQATKDDPRITPVGRFIRRTSLDELPQLFNVLMGDMSLVGPRPHAIQHDAEYSERINDYFARHHIKPGITGLAQVRGFRGETPDDQAMIQRIEADIEYINKWSVWLDFTILMRTFFAFGGKNAY